MDLSTVPERIELGLDRVCVVAKRLGVLAPTCPVITVAGTNGKGSTVAGLASIYRAAGYRVGAFTTPCLFKQNEQINVDGHDVSDDDFYSTLKEVDRHCQAISLTPFELNTLAALLIFKQQSLDVMILEVGLGGRLDAVNVIDADVAIVTSIALDHMQWLGSTRDAIAIEKAGIFRTGKPAIYGEEYPPSTLLDVATNLSIPLYVQGQDFSYIENNNSWTWQYKNTTYDKLPLNQLYVQNMSTVLMAITLLQEKLPVTKVTIDQGLTSIQLTGRVQVVPGEITKIYDVAHNPAAIAYLAAQLKKQSCTGKTIAVFSMLADKDIQSSLQQIKPLIDKWYVAPLATPRAANQELLQKIMADEKIKYCKFFPSIKKAYDIALSTAVAGDRIVIFGSFHTVAEVMCIV